MRATNAHICDLQYSKVGVWCYRQVSGVRMTEIPRYQATTQWPPNQLHKKSVEYMLVLTIRATVSGYCAYCVESVNLLVYV